MYYSNIDNRGVLELFSYDLSPIEYMPFAHVIVDSFLASDDYRTLHNGFPSCPPNSGPTGYSCFRDDPAHAALLEAQPAWKAFFAKTQCQTFVDFCLAQFSDVFAREALVGLAGAHFVPYIETRADKERRHLSDTGLAAEALFVRGDILQGHVGYARRPHLDHRRRAATMLIYFCDAEDTGGDLILHGAGGMTKIVRPRHNRMVMFPCCNASLHSVSKIEAQRNPRNFIQISVSSTVDLWPPAKSEQIDRTLWQRMRKLLSADA